MGRIRNRDQVSADGGPWQPVKDLHALPTGEAQEITGILRVRNHPVRRRLVLIKKPPKGRIQRTRFGSHCRSKRSRQIAKRQQDPFVCWSVRRAWRTLSPAAIVALHARRMSIEQSFRDTRNPQLGQCLGESRSCFAQRFEMLLMIGHLACRLLRLIGEYAQQEQMTFCFKAPVEPNARKYPSSPWLVEPPATVCIGFLFPLSKKLFSICNGKPMRLSS
jgi:hypothetical protein